MMNGSDLWTIFAFHSPELSWWQQTVAPLFNVMNTDIVPGAYDTHFVESTSEVDHNLAGSVVINHLKFTDVTYNESRDIERTTLHAMILESYLLHIVTASITN